MKTLKIQVEQTTTEKKEVEVTLPCWRKSLYNHFKITESGQCIQVANYHSGPVIQMREIDVAFGKDSQDSNEEEFETAFDKAVNHFENL